MVNSNELRAVLEEKYFINVNFGHVDKKEPGWCSGCMLPSGSSGTNNHNWKRWSVQIRYRADRLCCFLADFRLLSWPSTGFSVFFFGWFPSLCLFMYCLSFSIIPYQSITQMSPYSTKFCCRFATLSAVWDFFRLALPPAEICKIWDWTVQRVVKWLGMHRLLDSDTSSLNATARVCWLAKLVYFFGQSLSQLFQGPRLVHCSNMTSLDAHVSKFQPVQIQVEPDDSWRNG